jgi:hypothetical protein
MFPLEMLGLHVAERFVNTFYFLVAGGPCFFSDVYIICLLATRVFSRNSHVFNKFTLMRVREHDRPVVVLQ